MSSNLTKLLAKRFVLSVLEERGLINQIAGDRNALDHLLRTRKLGIYAGIDPTAPSLHLGHLLPYMVLFWLYHHGHHVVSLVGGATSKVGDPSGRLVSRAQTAESVMQANFEAMYAQVGGLWENVVRYGKRHRLDECEKGVGKRELLNNAEWLDGLGILTFLRMMGNGMRLGAMLGRDTVRNKMEKGDGMSFAEFTYPLLQGWDWWQMYQDRAIQVQVGGGDQYGNIIAGMDAVNYIAQNEAESGRQKEWLDAEGRLKEDLSPYGLTVPLLTTSSGEKFGKSAGNAVWLDPNLTSPFDLYGFLLRSADEDVERYLKLFTFVPLPEITSIMQQHTQDPGKRKAQHLLAAEVLELVHGVEVAAKTQVEHQAMRAPTVASLLRTSSTDAETQRTKLPQSLVHNTTFGRILYHAGLVATKSEGSRLVSKGGVYVASPSKTQDGELSFTQIKDQQPSDVEDLIVDGLLILRLGKWKVRVIEVLQDEEFDAENGDAPGRTEHKANRL
ncbi:hypothetical protein PRZ48_001363 [Zasmidium cellare]|uniref:Tyrosine--tRNA ligase n=1 Tax=Zasmidium cellare TaxID=395010 RepID=A0ABR0F2X6_ZASCE|nr:hypothetical protein PRZ48_001363 [Zasmidium cellare]